MNDSKFALSNLTKSRWLRLSASVGLAAGLAVVMLLLPIMAGTTITLTVPTLTQLNSPQSPGANWSVSQTSIEVGLPFAVQPAAAVGGITVKKTANFTTYYQGGLAFPSTFQPGEIEYTIVLTNNTGNTINPPFYISDTIPSGATCSNTDNNGNANWTHNFASCKATGVAQFSLASGSWANGTTLAFKFYVLPNGWSNGFPQSQVTDDGVYTVTNTAVMLHNPGGSFNGGLVATTDASDSVNVATAVKAPVWQVTKTAPATVTSIGGPISYSLTIANTGPYTINPNVKNQAPFANNSWVTITEWLPTNVVSGGSIAYTSLSTNTTPKGFVLSTATATTTKITWVITDPAFELAPGAVYAVPFVVSYTTVPTLPAGYEIVNNQYSVTGGDNVYYPGVGAAVTTTVQGPGSLEVLKTSSSGYSGNVTPGGVTTAPDLITYTIRFTYGSAVATVKITDMLPVDTEYPWGGAPVNYDFKQLVDYVAGSVSTAGSTVPVTVTPIVSATTGSVSQLLIQGGTGVTGSVGVVQFTVRMHSFMPTGMRVDNKFEVFPVVAVITSSQDGVMAASTTGYVRNLVNSASDIRYTKVAFPNVIDPVSGNPNFTYTLIITNAGDNGWTTITLLDDLTPYTWAQFTGLNPDYDPANLALKATNITTYTNGNTVWDNTTQNRVITAATPLDDRYWLLKAKVITTNPVLGTPVGTFCNAWNTQFFVTTSFGGITPPVGTADCVQVASPRISVTKLANVVSPSTVVAGDKIVYTYYITNAGTVPLKNVVLTDVFATGTKNTPMTITPTTTTLAVSGFTSATYTYTVVVSDVDTVNALLRNVVTASALANVALATPPAATATDSYTIPVFIAKTISMTKYATYTVNPLRASLGITLPTWGDVITYYYVLTNNSTVLYGISSIVDNPLGTIVPVFPAETINGLSSRTFSKTVKLDDSLIAQAIMQANSTLTPTELTLTNTASLVGTFNDSPPLASATQYTNTVTATVRITYVAGLSVTKQAASPTTTKTIGDSINYTVFLTNTGGVTLALPAGVLTDTLMGNTGWILAGGPLTKSASVTSLAPGASTSIPYSQLITEALAYYASPMGTTGSMLTNTVAITVDTMASTAILTSFTNFSVTNVISNITSSVSVPMVYTPSLLVKKTVNTSTASVGNVLGYSIVVTNNGNVTLTGITVTDVISYEGASSPLTVTTLITTLAAGAPPASYSYNYTVTSPLLGVAFDTGKIITNTAWVTANFNLSSTYGSVYTVSNSSAVTVVTNLAKDLQVQKTVTISGGASIAKLGDMITYTYKVMNNSTLPVTATLRDDKCVEFETGPVGGCGGFPYDIATNIVLSGTADAGASISTTQRDFTSTVLVDENLLRQALQQTPPSLTLYNKAWATGLVAGGATVDSLPVTGTAQLTITENLAFAKWATILNANGVPITNATEARVNDIIRYTFVVTNNGNMGYHAYSIDDVTLFGNVAGCTFAEQNAKVLPPIIAANSVFTKTCDYVVDGNTMAYIKLYGVPASTLVNTATVIVTPSLLVKEPQATNVLTRTTAVLTRGVVLTSPAQIQLAKVPSVMTASVGDTVWYTYYVSNTGSIDFESQFAPPGGNAFALYDNKLGNIATPALVLAAGGNVVITKSHVVTYSDFNPNAVVSGTLWLTNTATATGYVAAAFGSAVPSVPALAKVALVYTVNVNIFKTSNRSITEVLSLGEPIVYTLTLENNSTIPVTVTLSDVYENGAPSQSTDLPTTVWVAANSITNVVYHDSVLPAYLNSSLLTQTLRNIVTATVNDGLGNLNQALVATNLYTDTDDEVLTAIYDLNVQVVKSTTTPVVVYGPTNNVASYTYVLTNTGKTTQTLTSLVDWYQGYPQSMITVATNIQLGPNQSQTFNATFVVSDTYLDYAIAPNRAVITNIAKANIASGSLTVPFNSNPVTTTVIYTPSLSVKKSASLSTAQIGDTITYTVLVANDGLITLRNIIFEDRLLGVVNKTSFNMSPGGVPATFIVTKTITQKDFDTLQDGGIITNTANVTGSRGMYDYAFNSNPVGVTIRSGASLTITKIGSATQVQVPATVVYTYTVTNNGTVTLTGVTLTDDKLTLNVPAFDLAKDAVKVVTASATLTQPNITVTNIATAKATFVNPIVATATWSVKTTSGATCTVSVNALTPVLVGQASAMTATVLPAGSATFAWNFGDSSTGTGASTSHAYTAAGTYTVTVTATHANSAVCMATTTVVVNPVSTQLAFAKTANPASGSTVTTGSKIVYQLTVTNTTANTVTGVTISDTLPAGVTFDEADAPVTRIGNGLSFTVGDLLGNEFETIMVTVTVNATSGTLVNSAFASSDTGSTAVSSVNHTVGTAAPNLQITKTTQRPTVLQVGTRMTYTIRVSNTGNAVAKQVVITDVLPAAVTLVTSPTSTVGSVTVVSSTIRVDVGDLNPSAQAIVTIVVQVNESGVGLSSIVNNAFVSSLETPVANGATKTDPADENNSNNVIKKPQVMQFLPVIIKEPAATVTPTPTATPTTQPGLPNLKSQIKLPSGVAANQAVEVEVVVTNAGSSAVTQGFWVEFYINPNDAAGLATRGGRWDSEENIGKLADPLGKQGIAWEVKASDLPNGSLAPGASITLVSRPVGDAGLNGRKGFDAAQTTWHGRFVSGTSTLVSYADSYAGSGKPGYIVVESSETDNANTLTAPSFGPLGEGSVDLSPAPFHPAR